MGTDHTTLDQRLRAASLLLGEGDCESAEAVLRSAAELAPQSATVLTALGNVLSALGRHVEAVAAYTDAIESRPDYPGAVMGLAVVCFALGEPEQGRELLHEASTMADAAAPESIPTADQILGEYERVAALPELRRAAIMARLRAYARMRGAVKLCRMGD